MCLLERERKINHGQFPKTPQKHLGEFMMAFQGMNTVRLEISFDINGFVQVEIAPTGNLFIYLCTVCTYLNVKTLKSHIRRTGGLPSNRHNHESFVIIFDGHSQQPCHLFWFCIEVHFG